MLLLRTPLSLLLNKVSLPLPSPSSALSLSNPYPYPNPHPLFLRFSYSSGTRRRTTSMSSSSSAPGGGARTVADVLMGAARAAAAKKSKKNPASSSALASAPKPTSDDPVAAPSPAKKPKILTAAEKTVTDEKKDAIDEKTDTELELKKKGLDLDPKPASVDSAAASFPPKKAKTLAAAAEKKKKIDEKKDTKLELKKKGLDFDPKPAPVDSAAAPSPPKKPETLAAAAEKKKKIDDKDTKLELKKKGLDFDPKLAPVDPAAAPSSPKKSKTLAAAAEKKDEKRDARLELKKKGFDFDPKAAAFWNDGEPVPFLFFAQALDLISKESGRIAMAEILCNVFRTVIATTPKDLLPTVYLSANKIAPPHEGIELGIGDAALIKALAEAYGSKEVQIKQRLKDTGDLGSVANASRSSMRMMFKKPYPLTISKVLDTLRAIAKESGKDSQEKKRNHIKALLVAATDCEPQYIVRLLQTKMRIGLAEKTVLVALGQSAVYSETGPNPNSHIQSSLEEASNIIKQVYSVLPIYDKIVPALLEVGVRKLPEACNFSLGVPVGPMLAKPTKSVSEILDKFQGIEFTCEYKYDGERAQIHYMEDGSVEIYSRNAERNTGKYPDVVSSVLRFKKTDVKSFVLDCEIVAYDREKQKILPFQILSTRARKGVIISDIKVAVCTFAFDILYVNGQPLLRQQLKVRREHLYNSFEEVPGVFQFATATTSNDLEEVQKFLDAAVNISIQKLPCREHLETLVHCCIAFATDDAIYLWWRKYAADLMVYDWFSCEGLIIKTLDKDATYEPSKRSNNWLKLKKDYMESIGDSLDLVPIAAFHGRGKRTGVYGAFLLACYDEHNEEYQSICKIGTGFSESQLEDCSASLRNKIIAKPKPYYRCGDTMNPDVWFEPAEVWEVKAADLSISPVHRAANGIVDPNKGISLRFPRLLRVRDDKKPEEATTSEQVADMYRAQKINHTNNQDDEDDD